MSFFENFNNNLFLKKTPPADSSMLTLKELGELRDMYEDLNFVKYYDNINGSFKKFFKLNDLYYPEDFVQEVLYDSSRVITEIKNYFDRARPYVLASKYGIDLDPVYLKSALTPAYPSGHAAQGILLAKIFGIMYPHLAYDFMEIGNNIGLSRKIGKVHYDSDIKVGKQLGEALFDYIKITIDEEF